MNSFEGQRRGAMRTLTLLAAAAMVAAACSSSGSPAATTPAATTAPASVPAVSTAPASAGPSSAAASPASRTIGEPVPGIAWDKDIPLPTCDLSGKKMVYISVLRDNPVLRIMAQGAIDGAKTIGFGDAKWLAPSGFDEPATAALGDQAIAQGIDGIVVFATSAAFYPMIKRAADAGIPVVQGHSPIDQGQAPGVLSVVATDPGVYGAASADAIAGELGKLGKTTGSIAVTEDALIPNENQAAAAFKSKMNQLMPNIKVLNPVAVGDDSVKVIAAETAIVQAHPDIVGVFATYGNAPVTWAQTQSDAGKKLIVIGMDYAKANLDNVKSGQIYGIVAQPLYQEHYEAAVLLGDYLCKQQGLQYRYSPPAPIVTSDALNPYYTLLSAVNIK